MTGKTNPLSDPAKTGSDSQIIEGLKRRDPGAMTDLYDRHGSIVYSVVCRMVGTGGKAEEIVQETFLCVWTRAHLIEGTAGALGPWLLTIARNLALASNTACDQQRRSEPTSHAFMSAPASFDPTRPFSNHTERLRRAFTDLAPEQRAVIELTYFENLSQTEISELMGKPLGVVKIWMRTALGVLRKS